MSRPEPAGQGLGRRAGAAAAPRHAAGRQRGCMRWPAPGRLSRGPAAAGVVRPVERAGSESLPRARTRGTSTDAAGRAPARPRRPNPARSQATALEQPAPARAGDGGPQSSPVQPPLIDSGARTPYGGGPEPGL